MNAGEIIQLHVGQAGIQLGNACWELYCIEHGINLDGTLSCCGASNTHWNSFFNCTSCGNVVPRIVMVDSEPVVIDEIKSGPYSRLFKSDTLISGKEDSGNNFARGFCAIAEDLLDTTMEAVRKLSEECPRLEGFFMFRAIGGGTGSGLGTRILEKINEYYGPKCNKSELCVFPSPCLSPVVVEPINSVLAMHGGAELVDNTFVISNEALYNIYDKKLYVDCPTFANINRLIAQVISSLTASMRFESPLSIGVREFKTNLVPFPKIHYSIISYAPILPIKRPCQDSLSAHKITIEALERDNTLADVNLFDGLLMASILLYRGNLSTADIAQEIQYVKSRNPAVSWSPSPVKIGLSNFPPACLPWGDLLPTPRALAILSNTTAIRHLICQTLFKYKTMVEKKAFLFHYFGEYLEESAIINAGDYICSLYNEYEDLNAQSRQEGGCCKVSSSFSFNSNFEGSQNFDENFQDMPAFPLQPQISFNNLDTLPASDNYGEASPKSSK